jgi:cell division septal protein FtsQ
MSFRKKHVKNKIYKTRPRKPIFKKWWFWILILVLATILAGFYFILFYPGFQIKNIEIFGNEKIGSQELQSIILSNINTGLLSKSIFLVNTDKISKEILEKFSTIKQAEVSKKFPQTITLLVAERKPIGVFCLGQGDECFLIDQDGIIFSAKGLPASGWENSQNMPIIRQILNNNAVYIGEQVIAGSIMDAIYKIQKTLKDNFDINIEEALVASPIRLNIKTNENWQVYFDIGQDSDVNAQAIKLNLLLSEEISKDTRKDLRYINLIPKDRAIICDNSVCGAE